VTIQREDWDDDERRALEGLQAELERVRARHSNDPPFELLRAADAEALPETLQTPCAEHLAQSAWSRALVAGAAEADPLLDAVAQRRLLTRIERSARATASTAPLWKRPWLQVLATAAVLVLVVNVFRRGEPTQPFEQLPPAAGTPSVTAAPPAPVFALPLDKPDVKLTATALILRNERRDAGFVTDIAPALDAYRASDYQTAERRFAALAAEYPQSVEVAFYRAVAQLFLNDATAAILSLQSARRLDDDTFAAEIGWYLAVAHERAGEPGRARAELDSLCRQSNAYTPRACAAAGTFKPE
jgi:hypothetical protein